MALKRVPEKYKRCGIKIKCLKCKFQISKICKLNGTRLEKCEHQDKHKYQAIVCIPNTKNSRNMKILKADTFEEALIEGTKYRTALKENNYQNVKVKKEKEPINSILSFAVEYIDMMSGVNTPKYLKRNRSKAHISETQRVISRFLEVLKNKGYNVETLNINHIGHDEIDLFHDFLIDDLKIGKSHYNKHFVIMKTFFNWVIKFKNYNIRNPFSSAELSFEKKEKTIIKKEDFNNLLSVINYDNGWELLSHNKRRNHFQPWIKNAFRFALETGLRREELLCVQWNDIEEIEGGVMVLNVLNRKVNRILTGNIEGEYIRTIPVTKSLMNLLIEMGFNSNIGSQEFLFPIKGKSIDNMMRNITTAFSHFSKQVTENKISFKHLRKTYITKLVLVLGDKAKMFTGQTNNEIIKNHYLSEAYLAGSLNNFEIF